MTNRWKRVALLGSVMIGCFTVGVWADDGIKKIEAYLRYDMPIALDGQPVKLNNPPILYQDRTYLPVAELAKMLDVEVNWDEQTNTVYINSRFQGQPPSPEKEQTYEYIELAGLQPMFAKYLGVKRPVITLNANNNVYYRVSDMERLGIDCRGLKKVKAKYVDWLFVTESELAKVWKQRPAFDYAYELLFSDETDPEKIGKIKESLEFFSANPIPSVPGETAGQQYYGRGSTLYFIVDKLPEPDANKYRALAFTMGKFYFDDLELRLDAQKHWYVNNFQQINIQPNSPDPMDMYRNR